MTGFMFEQAECPNNDHPFDHLCALCGFQRPVGPTDSNRETTRP